MNISNVQITKIIIQRRDEKQILILFKIAVDDALNTVFNVC